MKKKAAAVLLCGIMLLSLAGCGALQSTVNGILSQQAEEAEQSAVAETQAQVETQPADAVSEESYIGICAQYTYDQLVNSSADLTGKPVTVTLTITKTAAGQYLGLDEAGKNYILFDERADDAAPVNVDDRITAYGDYDGLADVAGTRVPSIALRFMKAAPAPETPASPAATTAPPATTPAPTTAPTAPAAATAAAPAVPEYQTLYVINCNESITLRTSPSTSASEIRQIPLGAPVSFVENASNGFYKVIYQGSTGYALASYLGTSPQSSPSSSSSGGTYPAYQTLYVVNCNEYITLRPSPSTSSGEIRRIPLGAAVTYLADASNGFFKVSYMGDTGYALASYLSISWQESGSYDDSHGYSYNQTLYVVNCNEYITLRPGPSTSSGEIRHIPLGAAVTFLDYAANGFLKITYLGDTGFALADYLSP